jgi:hypothetical protein
MRKFVVRWQDQGSEVEFSAAEQVFVLSSNAVAASKMLHSMLATTGATDPVVLDAEQSEHCWWWIAAKASMGGGAACDSGNLLKLPGLDGEGNIGSMIRVRLCDTRRSGVLGGLQCRGYCRYENCCFHSLQSRQVTPRLL